MGMRRLVLSDNELVKRLRVLAHEAYYDQDLAHSCGFCSHLDAYRMGAAALRADT